MMTCKQPVTRDASVRPQRGQSVQGPPRGLAEDREEVAGPQPSERGCRGLLQASLAMGFVPCATAKSLEISWMGCG